LTESESVYHDITIYTTTENILDSSVASPKILGGGRIHRFWASNSILFGTPPLTAQIDKLC